MVTFNIGSRIRELREAQGIKRTELARLVGISAWQVARLESGEESPTTKMLLRIAEALAVKPIRFFEEAWGRNWRPSSPRRGPGACRGGKVT